MSSTITEFLPTATAVCSFLLTYLIHSTLIVIVAGLIVRRMNSSRHAELRLLVWKLALVLPLMTTIAIATFQLPHFGVQLALSESLQEPSIDDRAAIGTPVTRAIGTIGRTSGQQTRLNELGENESVSLPTERYEHDVQSSSASVSLPKMDTSKLWVTLAVAWLTAIFFGFFRLGVKVQQLRKLRQRATVFDDDCLNNSFTEMSKRMKLSRRVELRQSSEISGPIAGGVIQPFILLPAGLEWGGETAVDNASSVNGEHHLSSSERDAILAHELAHIIRFDATWNLIAQFVSRAFPFQLLNRWVTRQLQKHMDFVADYHAAHVLGERSGLIRCLLRLSERITNCETHAPMKPILVSGMVAFRSTLGQRVEILLDEDEIPQLSSRSSKLKLLIAMIAGSFLTASVLPQAVAERPRNTDHERESPISRNNTMKEHLTALAVLVGFTSPVTADALPEQPAAVENSAELKTTPDPLPAGIRNFNGMLVGRLADKDVEKGSFVVYVDAVPRVWRNSKAQDPKSIVGKTIQVKGVFGKFLDVLVVTRKGETVEFECKHDGETLVFPGELLRKVAAYKAEDYPVLPEEFRGFRGAVKAEIVKKDPETFELIVKVHEITDTWKENSAKKPESIKGKTMMLAGFWNRKEDYHKLKVGDRIEVGMQHIAMRSDHMSLAEFVRKAGEAPKSEPKKREGEAEQGGLDENLNGFRGMLVGRLVEKDIERGTFTITVDAVPRVWNNNKARNPKGFIGQKAAAGGVQGKMLDALVVTRVGETIEFGALHDEGDRLRVGEVLRKVAPVKEGDYPELPDGFRGFKGMLIGKVVKKDDHLMDLIIEVKSIEKSFDGNRAKAAESIVGKRATLAGFWRRKEIFHDLNVGDMIQSGVEHPQRLSDHLSVIESVKKIETEKE